MLSVLLNSLGPILRSAQLTFYTTHVLLLVCTRHKADVPPVQPGATTLRLERRVGGKQRRVPAQIIPGAILPIETLRQWNCATDREIPGLNALADSAVGVAILTCHGRSELQHTLTHT